LATSCLTCDLSGGQQLFLDVITNICGLKCSQNYYSGFGGVYQCNQCDISCISCNAINSNNGCTTCNEAAGYNLALASTTKCILGCPQGQYVTGSPKVCNSCDANCLTCQTTATNCLSCGLSVGSQMFLNPSATCVVNCPSKYYPESISKTCLPCDSSCLTCSGPLATNCISCDKAASQQMFLNLSSGTCGLTCSQNYYSGSGGVYQCNQCDISCLKCSTANTNADCQSCNEAAGYNLALTSTTKCILGCPQGQYLIGSPKVCSSCDANCLTCQTTATNCLSCGLSGSSQMYLTLTATCSVTCPSKYFPDSITKTCVACHSTCLSCSGSLASNCLTCDVSGTQQLFLDAVKNTCNLTCSLNYYSGPGPAYECNQCHISCLTCTASNSATACISCN
jgi:proprotein convertase subtilisin/kexin type 5